MRKGFFFLVKHLHASMPRSWCYGRNQAAASHVQLRVTQSRRSCHIGVACLDSLMASKLLDRNHNLADEVFSPVQILSQINNRIARG